MKTITQEIIANYLKNKESNIIPLKQIDLENILADKVGASFISIVTRTVPRMRKTDNPYLDKISKVATASGLINFDYSQRQQKITGEEKTVGSSWYSPVEKDGKQTPLVEKKSDPSQKYLRMEAKTIDSQFLLDGEKINKETISSFLPKNKHGNVTMYVPKLENVIALTMDGNTYININAV